MARPAVPRTGLSSRSTKASAPGNRPSRKVNHGSRSCVTICIFTEMLAESERLVVGYHGTSATHAEVIVREGLFQPSENDYDWLGHGIYFWEEAPCRAWRWARRK